MLKISFREFGMSFKNAIIIASDIGDLIYKESNRKGELNESFLFDREMWHDVAKSQPNTEDSSTIDKEISQR